MDGPCNIALVAGIVIEGDLPNQSTSYTDLLSYEAKKPDSPRKVVAPNPYSSASVPST